MTARELLIVLLFLGACQPTAATLPARLQAIQQRGQLIAGTAITQPFEYYEGGTLVGYDVDLLTVIAGRLNVSVSWQEMTFADLLNQLMENNVDVVIAAMYITEEREALVDFSTPYLATGLVLVVRADETAIQTVADLGGRRVGVKEGATGDFYAQYLLDEQDIALQIFRYTDTLDSLNDLNDGFLDAVFNDQMNTLYYIQQHPGVRIQGGVLQPAELGIAVTSGDSELLTFINSALAEMRANGELDRLFDRWLNPETVP
jgi:ABC-type amino acid transport substrate-binding protein